MQRVQELLQRGQKDPVTVREFADLVCRSPFTIRMWIKRGRIEAKRVIGTGPRGRLLIDRNQLSRVIQAGRGSNLQEPLLD
jgi:hypothetical protein